MLPGSCEAPEVRSALPPDPFLRVTPERSETFPQLARQFGKVWFVKKKRQKRDSFPGIQATLDLEERCLVGF